MALELRSDDPASLTSLAFLDHGHHATRGGQDGVELAATQHHRGLLLSE